MFFPAGILRPRARVSIHLGDTRGAQLVEYLVLVGFVALGSMLGFRWFGARVADKASAQAACVATLACAGGGQPEVYALVGAVGFGRGALSVAPAVGPEAAPMPAAAPAEEDAEEDADEDADEDDCSGWSLCQIGDAVGSATDFVWDDTGLDSLVSNTVGGAFWRTWDNITHGGNAWYEWPLDAFEDLSLLPLQVGGNLFQEALSLPEWLRQSWEGRDLPTTGAEWALPPGGETMLFQQLPGETDAITPTDVVQGGIGTCVTLAGLGAIASVSPETIRDAVRDNGDGTYTVTFHEQRMPGMIWDREWTTHEVTVDARAPVDESGNLLSAQAPYGETWPLIIEKAWAEYNGGYHRINGDSGSALLEAVTGHTASFHESIVDAAADQLPGSSPVLPSLETLGRWHDSGRAIITGVHNHMLYILDVDVESGTLTIGNPWGAQYTRTISYDEWKNGGEFRSLSVVSTDATDD